MTRTLLLGLLLAAAARAGELELPVVEATLDDYHEDRFGLVPGIA